MLMEEKLGDMEENIPGLDAQIDMIKQPLPKDLQGRIPNGIYYYLCHLEGKVQEILIVISIKNDKIDNLMSLDAKSLFKYLNINRVKFEDKFPTGVV